MNGGITQIANLLRVTLSFILLLFMEQISAYHIEKVTCELLWLEKPEHGHICC